MDENLTITLTLDDSTSAQGVYLGQDDTHVHVRLSQVYETQESIWLPGNTKAFSKQHITSPIPQSIIAQGI